SSANIIGGTVASARNVLSGNGFSGVAIIVNTSIGNQVLGNNIGTDLTGTANIGNADPGIFIQDAQNNAIGGSVAGARNVITGNLVGIGAGNSTGNLIQGNFIGTDASGAVPGSTPRDG